MTNHTQNTNPQDLPAVFTKNFNTGDIKALIAGYTSDAVLNLGGGKVFRGHAEIRQALANFLAPKLPMIAKPRSSSVHGNIALVLFDWSIEGKAPDGQAVSIKGTAADVLQRDTQGVWRQVIDYPFGNSSEPQQ